MIKKEIISQDHHSNKKILILSLNNPQKLNAFNHDLLFQLNEEIKYVDLNEEINGIIIKSSLEKAFCTGIDTTYVNSLSNSEAADFFTNLAKLFEEISNLRVPTVSIMNGYAFGAGADLALACDIRIASETTLIRFPGPQFGIVLGTHRLASEVGNSLARYLTFTNKVLNINEALQYGLVHSVVQDEIALNIAISQLNIISNLSKYAFYNIRNICSHYSTNPLNQPVYEYTNNSVLYGDFQDRLKQYLERIASNRKIKTEKGSIYSE